LAGFTLACGSCRQFLVSVGRAAHSNDSWFQSAVQLLVLLAIVAAPSRFATAQTTSPLSIVDALRMRSFSYVSPVAFSPDGKWIVYNVRDNQQRTEYDFEQQEARTGVPWEAIGAQLYILNVDTAAVVDLTRDKGSNWLPTWSHDGRYLAFLSDRDGSGQARLWIWNGSDLKRVSDLNIRAGWLLHEGQLEWAPDSRHLLIGALPAGISVDESLAEQAPTHGDRTVATIEEPGSSVILYTPTVSAPPWNLRRAIRELAVIDVTGGKLRSSGSAEEIASYHLSPDGSRIAFTVPKRFESAGSQQVLFDLIVVSLETGERRVAAHDIRLDYSGDPFSWSPDGMHLSYRTSGAAERAYDICVFDVASGVLRNVTRFAPQPHYSGDASQAPLWDRRSEQIYFLRSGALWRVRFDKEQPSKVADVVDRSITEVISESNSLLWTSNDGGSTIVVTHDDIGKQDGFYKIDLGTGATAKLLEAGQCYTCETSDHVILTSSRKQLLYFAEDARRSPDLWIADASFENARPLTHLNPQFDKYAMGTPRLIKWLSDDGALIRGALLLPSGYQEGKHYPLVVYLYGGALLSDEFDRFGFELGAPFNMQLLATRGFAVLLPDAPLDKESEMLSLVKVILPGINKLIDAGIADPDRMGVMGHSNGGYSTLALIVQTNRFKAAVDIAGTADLIAHFGEMDINGMAFGNTLTEGRTPWRDTQWFIDNSPLFHFDRIDTPLLIVQGDVDTTVAPFMSDEVYVALQFLGRTVEYAKYQGEHHSPMAWTLANQKDFCNRMIGWFDKYLKGDGSQQPSSSPPTNVPNKD